ncbi:MAG TPA: hypothetical protein VK279_01440 [Solirubrobacteraceae bacterium]|nr:hypothetical protein [Solirubrobacteraceae bacterium]
MASTEHAAEELAGAARQAPDEIAERISHAVEILTRAAVLTRDRLEEVVDDAVERGRMTRGDAEQLVTELFRISRRTTEDLMADFEQLVGRSGQAVTGTAGNARARAGSAAKSMRQAPPVDRALREVDRARRAAGVGPTFPIIGYDDLTAGQVSNRLTDLTPAELRKVRDYERRNANRKSVLNTIEKRLA